MKPPGESVDGDLVLRLRITGRVQGVWFRGWLVQCAEQAGLRGWVRNRPDRSVEALLIGGADQVNSVTEQCKSGPPAARVLKVEAARDMDDGSVGFRQRPTQ